MYDKYDQRVRPSRAILLWAALTLPVAPVAVGEPIQDTLPGKGEPPHEENAKFFRHISSFDVMAGNGSSVAEILDVSDNGKQLIYTDSGNQAIGFIDIRRPRFPLAGGVMPVGGEPTSLVIRGNQVLVGVNTSPSLAEPAGKLVVVHRITRAVLAEHELGGQPDSLAVSPDGKYLAIVLENERDEDLNGGLIPQAPGGELLIARLEGHPSRWDLEPADLSPVAASAAAGGDLEPEFVDINEKNLAVVSFQENNHLAVIDLKTGKTISEFPAGSVDLTNVDTEEEALINLDTSITRRREPDAVAWIDHDSFATANEGDYEDANGEEGGSRGFTIFNIDGTVKYESAESFEHLLVRLGHYNEDRSENKGVEPESVEVGRFGHSNLLFVGSERSNAVGVYDVTNGAPRLVQVLPTGIGPEGLKGSPKHGLFFASTETDEAAAGIPTMVNVYRQNAPEPRYPMIASIDDVDGLPIPWLALSGLAADPVDPFRVYAVSDAYLAQGFVYTIDTSTRPARIVHRLLVSGASTDLDLEGIAVGSDGYLWLAVEGNADSIANAVVKVDPSSGEVIDEFNLPADLESNARSNGFEGISVTGAPGEEIVYVAIQRAWPAAGDVDEAHTRIGRYDVVSGEWGFVYYPLEAEGGGDWIGLSDLTPLPNGQFAVIERDKGWGPTTGFNAELKALFMVDLAGAEFRAHGADLLTLDKSLLADVLPQMARRSIWTAEKLEGFAVTTTGKTWLVTDNDGVDGATGETLFFSLGNVRRLLR